MTDLTDLRAATAARFSATGCVRAGIDCDDAFGAVVPPLHLSSNFSFDGYGGKRRYDYTRSGNPTRDHLSAALSQAEGGATTIVTASGMAAVALALELLEPGDRLVVPHDGYGGSHRLFTAFAARGRFVLDVIDFGDADAVQRALAKTPAMVWIETPSNPLLRVTDIRHVATLAHAVGARVVVDNTFLSPALQRPIALGADLVVHSTTKYINGHSDVVGGAVVCRDAATGERLAWWANALGVTGSPFDAWLTLRGLRTLSARLAVQQANAGTIATHLARCDGIVAVHYPGLPDHADHALAARQQDGFGAMVSIELAGEREVRAFLDGLRHFTLAESLGGVESLVAHPATMTHAAMPAPVRVAAGITDGLLRLSVGIEDVDDLLADLDDALARVTALRTHRAVSA